MPRRARTIAVGYPHHVAQRGNDRRVVFTAAQDYIQYRNWLAHYASKYGLEIWAYCLMPNHVHVVAVPLNPTALPQTFKLVNMKYAQRYNESTGATGHLWEGRYFSCVLDERHTQAAVRYVETNPVRGGLAATAEAYPWSSAAAHVTGRPDIVLSGVCFLTERIRDWRAYLTGEIDAPAQVRLQRSTLKGLPCGEEPFVRRIEQLLGRCFDTRTVGRPRLRPGDMPGESLFPDSEK